MKESNIGFLLDDWGLPPLVINWYKKKGISKLFDWQAECLCKNDVLKGGNLVYSAPTSAGKTLVADFLLLKKVLECNKKAIVIEPFIALTREKASQLKSMLHSTKARVGAFGGSYYTPGGMTAVSVAVCTIEKANNFFNKLINEGKLSEIGIIVVDEIHFLGDESRGYHLELLLTKVLFYNKKQDKNNRIQIVGLSATIPNLETIAVWLDASLYVTEYRPVPLVEKIKIDNNIYNVVDYLNNPSNDPIENINPATYMIEQDFDGLFYLCLQSIMEGHSTLVFCETKRECEIMATKLADQIKISGAQLENNDKSMAVMSKKLRENISSVKIKDVLTKLKKCPAGPDKELVRALYFGVAFHHAGLTTEEREIIEDGFKSGGVRALMATSTLSSGVNLPARRVIIKSPTTISYVNSTFQKEMLHPNTYKQMVGRAGRKNIDTCGESILICNNENKNIAIKLVRASMGDIVSALGNRMLNGEGEAGGLKKAILEVIANGTAQTRVHLNQYLKSSYWLFCFSMKEQEKFMTVITETLRYLIDNKFIEELKPGVYRATRLGNAVLASGLHPDESLELLNDLLKAREGFCLLNDLHIIYQVTPNNIARAVDIKDWHYYSNVWLSLDPNYQSVGQKVGVEETTIIRKCQGYLRSMSEDQERVYKRFWVALAINDLISEVSLPKICSKYSMTKSTVQQAQRAVAQFAGVISIFCQELGYDNIAALVIPLESRINFSCQRDLLDLIKLNLTRPIARTLFNAGYKNIIALAKADKLHIEFVIRQTKPFRKDISFTEHDQPPTMWVPELATNMTTLDYASHIVDTARSHIEIELDIELTPSNQERVDSKIGSKTVSSNTEDQRSRKRERLDEGIYSIAVI